MIAGAAALLSGAGKASTGAPGSSSASTGAPGDGRSYADFAASAASTATGGAASTAGANAAAQSAPATQSTASTSAPATGGATPPAGGSDTMQPSPSNAAPAQPAAQAGAAGIAAASRQIRRDAGTDPIASEATLSLQAALTPQAAEALPAPLATSVATTKDDTQPAPTPVSDPQQLLALLAGSLAITAPTQPVANAGTLPTADTSVTGTPKGTSAALIAGQAVGAGATALPGTVASTDAAKPTATPPGDAQPAPVGGPVVITPAPSLTDVASLPTTDTSAPGAGKGATAALIAGSAAGALQQSPGLVSTGALAALLDPKAATDSAPADALKLAVNATLEREGGNGFALPDGKDDRPGTVAFGGLVSAAPSLDRPLTANAVAATPLALPAHLDDGFDDGLGTRIAWMAEQKLGHAEIRLNPEHAGPIDVRIQLDGTQVNATFHSANADVRQALEASLPRLRDLLGQQGLQLGNADIGQRQQSSQQQDQGAAPRSQGPSFGSDVFGNGSASAQATVAPVVLRSRGLLDEYA